MKKNVVFLVFDGMRVDQLKLFPTFQKLVSQGSTFTNCITYAPSTIAAMHAMFSGTYGTENGVNNYWANKRFKHDTFKLFAQYLQNAGYYTRGDSINELVCPKHGFDKLTVHSEFVDDLKKDHPVLLEQTKKDAGEKPFLLYLHYSTIHAQTTKNVMDKTDGEFDKAYYERQEQNRRELDSYVKDADDYLAALQAKLQELHLQGNTIIVAASDHGTSVGDKFGERRYGVFCYDYTIRTFCIFAGDAQFPAQEFTAVARSIDILPTLLEALNIEMEDVQREGKSLFPIIKGTEQHKRIAFTETATLDVPARREPNIGSIRTDAWKIIHNKTTGKTELYDLKNDPAEENNVAGKNSEEEKLLWPLLKKKMELDELSIEV